MNQENLKNFISKVQKESKTDMMFVACDKNNNVSVTLVGDDKRVAQSILASIFDKKNIKVATALYNMVKNLAYSIVSQPSEQGADLLAMMSAIAEQVKEQQSHKLALNIPLNPQNSK